MLNELIGFFKYPSLFSFVELIVGIVAALVVIFLTMTVHEFAHAYAATKLGDPTPKFSGRLSLNPFNHIDYIGALCVLLFGFGWAKPVGVNPRNFNDVKKGMAITAVAGPFSNILLAAVSVFLSFATVKVYSLVNLSLLYWIALFFEIVASINVSLAVFNLIPIPPLDGSRILGLILPDRIYYRLMQYERYLYYAVLALIIIGAFDKPLGFLSEKTMWLISAIPNLIFFGTV